MSFIDYVPKNKLKNKATSNIIIYQVLSSLSLSDVGNFLRDGLFESDIEIVKLHPTEGTLWVSSKNENYFYSHGCWTAQKLSSFVIERNGF